MATRTKLRTRRDIENENAELRGAVAELRRQIEALQAKPSPSLEDIIREIQKLMPPQQPQVIPYVPNYPQPQPLPWYLQPTIPYVPNPVYPWDIYWSTCGNPQLQGATAMNWPVVAGTAAAAPQPFAETYVFTSTLGGQAVS